MALTLHKSKKHNRTLIAEINGEFLEISINYTGEGNGHKGMLLDGKVIPAILHAVNVKPIKIKNLKYTMTGISKKEHPRGFNSRCGV